MTPPRPEAPSRARVLDFAALEERVRDECATVLDAGRTDGKDDGKGGGGRADGTGPGTELALVEDGAVIRAERGTLLPEMVRSTHRDGGPFGMLENVIPTVGTAATFGTVIGLLTSSVLLPAVASYAMLAVLTRRRRQRAELGRVRGDATRHLNRVLTELTTEIPAQITDHVDGLADRLGLALDRAIADERLRLERRLTEHRRNLAASAAELAAARDRTKRRIGTLTTLRDEGLALAHGLAATGRPDPDRS
ncbi:hypothetical protein [Kitasatospora purpeofusca]|uniref:hypothetical protein n=1 Tax=Kitasatospora purpeofusca TaxID=67352 RepID=UPI00225327FB|nr:hypothetical protein [Kitasatospora purpeofusca]MCX4755646.1 hypothetical protein [Kitasatospora purpeofusca]WSR36491.1 hypothetical protein OG715_39375 [Kitasatospora purpeofusca]